MPTLHYESRREVIAPLLPRVIEIANSEKDALGFLSKVAYSDANERGHLKLLTREGNDGLAVLGFVLYSGIFPNARIQQIGVSAHSRRLRVGSRLLSCLVADLERQGFPTLSAKIASDLTGALAFYRANGFEQALVKRGGRARGRSILVHVRQLENPHLFSTHDAILDFKLKKRVEAPLYSFDLNVLFDLIRTRGRHEVAAEVFSAALDHRIRLAMASELVSELKRTSPSGGNDLLLQMAMRLPQLPAASKPELVALAEKVQGIIARSNGPKDATAQSVSDAKHVAHAALAGVTAFITSDAAILRAQSNLLSEVGIDVVSLQEFLDALPDKSLKLIGNETGSIDAYNVAPISISELKVCVQALGADVDILSEINALSSAHSCTSLAIKREDYVACLGYVATHKHSDHTDMFAYTNPEEYDESTLAEFLTSTLIRLASQGGPVKIRLHTIVGQSAVRRMASAQGFQPTKNMRQMMKVAVGGPLTLSRWSTSAGLIRRRTGLSLVLDPDGGNAAISLQSESPTTISFSKLEELIGPAIVAAEKSLAVVVPITKLYADELLGTSAQLALSFIERKPAVLRNRRGYVNSVRCETVMKPGRVALFYESQRSGGRGAIIAAARLVDAIVVENSQIADERRRMIVVDDMSDVSKSEQVLFNTFDNLLAFPNPVSRREMERLGVRDKTNFITAREVTGEQAAGILDLGWHHV